jgi:hypothetical protein
MDTLDLVNEIIDIILETTELRKPDEAYIRDKLTKLLKTLDLE